MATVPKFRIDVDIHNLLMNSNPSSQAARAEGDDAAGASIPTISGEAGGSRP